MDIEELILKKIDKQGSVKTSEIQDETGFSRAYINRFMRQLQEEGEIVRVGKANRTKYVKADKEALRKARRQIQDIQLTLENENLSEDVVLDKIQRETGIFLDLSDNIEEILIYAFTEMLNNAIEHSGSEEIKVLMERKEQKVQFKVRDFGIGIFRNIREERGLDDDLQAVQDLLKGKQTTAPKAHSGEGIYFTSKVVDVLTIRGRNKKIIFNNLIEDIFIQDTKKEKSGTKVTFSINLNSGRNLGDVFRRFTNGGFSFDKTQVKVELYEIGSNFVSRSQARRIVSGLNKFEKITLDFKNIETIGQAFADEIYRVWHNRHPEIKIKTINTNENVQFMINRARSME